MRVVHCTAEKPWGIHLALIGDGCPRCGWEVPKPELAAEPTPLPLDQPAPWVILTAGLQGPHQAAA